MKLKKRARTAITVWRTIAGTILFLILMPTFLAKHEGDHFYTIVLLTTAMVAGLLYIFKQPLRKKFRRYIETGMKLLLIGAVLLIGAASLDVAEHLKIGLLVLSALFYAFGVQRLGIGYFVGVP